MKEETARTLARLRSLLARGKTLEQAGRQIKRSKSAVHRLAVRHRFGRRRRDLPPKTDAEIRRRLRAARHTLRRIAELSRVSFGSVSRRSRQMTDRGSTFRPKGIRVPRRCPRHGLIKIWPCVACVAEAAAGKRSAPQMPPQSAG